MRRATPAPSERAAARRRGSPGRCGAAARADVALAQEREGQVSRHKALGAKHPPQLRRRAARTSHAPLLPGFEAFELFTVSPARCSCGSASRPRIQVVRRLPGAANTLDVPPRREAPPRTAGGGRCATCPTNSALRTGCCTQRVSRSSLPDVSVATKTRTHHELAQQRVRRHPFSSHAPARPEQRVRSRWTRQLGQGAAA